MAEEHSVTPVENQETPQSEIIDAAYNFANVLRRDADPMLDVHTNVKTCRTLTTATVMLLEGIGHHPVIKVKVDEQMGTTYHYWLEDPELGISIDYSPASHLREKFFDPSDPIVNTLSTDVMDKDRRSLLILSLASPEYKKILSVGKVEVRDRGKTSAETGEQGKYSWAHIHLERTPDTIKEALKALVELPPS